MADVREPVDDPVNLDVRAGRADRSAVLLEGEPCDVCGFPMLDVHCKLICRKCGFMRDCSDP